MAASEEFIEFILDQLRPQGHVTTRRMFDSVGLFHEGCMFALINRDNSFYLKADIHNAPHILKAKCLPFVFTRKDRLGLSKTVSLSYYAVPEGILEDCDELNCWTKYAIEAARQGFKKKMSGHCGRRAKVKR